MQKDHHAINSERYRIAPISEQRCGVAVSRGFFDIRFADFKEDFRTGGFGTITDNSHTPLGETGIYDIRIFRTDGARTAL